MFWTYLTTFLLLMSGCFLMLIVLLQRGRGGGLAGAFGGLGGQSAFGTKAGDVFTKITIGVAVFWVSMACVAGFAMRRDAEGRLFQGGSEVGPAEPTVESGAAGDEAAGGTEATGTEEAFPAADDEADETPQAGGTAGSATDTETTPTEETSSSTEGTSSSDASASSSETPDEGGASPKPE